MLWNETHLKSLNWKLFWNFHVYFTELFLLVRLTVRNFTNYISPWFWFHLWKISFLPGKCSLVGILERTISPPAQHPDESSPSRTSFSPPTHKNTISSRQAVNSFSLLMTQSTVDSAALILLTCIPHVPCSNGSQGSSVGKMTRLRYGWARHHTQITGRRKRFFSSPKRRTSSESHPASCLMDAEDAFPRARNPTIHNHLVLWFSTRLAMTQFHHKRTWRRGEFGSG